MEQKNVFYLEISGVRTEIHPHYKQLKKKYAKENNQMFFRESLDGKISLFGVDYLLVKNASVEATIYFYAYRGEVLFASALFNKSNCKFDHFKKSVELTLTYNDKYTKILDAYENTYDLIKLAPALTPLILTKRCVVQIYIQGENTLSNYAGGTYWETEVNEQIDDSNLLTNKYYFSKGPLYVEVDLKNFDYDINAAYIGLLNSNIWNATYKKEVNGVVQQVYCSIKFTKVFSADDIEAGYTIRYMSTGQGNATYEEGEYVTKCLFDTYRIEIYTGQNATGIKLYQSSELYGKDKEFILSTGENLYPMIAVDNMVEQSISVARSGYYIKYDGTTVALANSYISAPFYVEAGKTISFTGRASTSLAIISKTDISGSTYVPKVIGTGPGYQIPMQTATYKVTESGYYAVTWYMQKEDCKVGYPKANPDNFYLGENVIEHQVWGRLLCDVNEVPNHQQGHEGEMIATYDLPQDDFATPRRNYRKCIGLRGFDSNTSVITIWQNAQMLDSPTSYGINDYGKYFTPPYTLYGQYFYPLARSSWANISFWVKLGRGTDEITSFENFCAECYKEYSIKDVYHIGDVIKSLLAEIDPSISHEKTAEYSSFLYGHSGGTASILGNCDLYITQKTNILKGEYDQAAQKAEIKFKQLMDMLRDCFRCFWYIDNQNRFRIEHVSYFMKGLSYNTPTVQLDLTSKHDKFNKKTALYCQQEVEYDKTELISRYEFKYMDDVTKAMGGDLYVNINNAYVEKDKTEEINIDGFTTDIDYMLFLPDDFSNTGFALILANSLKKVPIIDQRIIDEKQYNRSLEVYVQNWYASFNNLVWHYMEDMPGNNISYNNIDSYLYVNHIKRCMKQDIKFPANNLSIDIYSLIKTDIGNGYIEEMAVDIETDIVNMELRYEPD